MRIPRFRTLRTRIIALVIVACGLAVGLFTVTIALANRTTSIRLLDTRLTTLADVIGQNSTAALDFHDRKTAGEVLGALKSEPSIASACLYGTHGLLFSEYRHNAPPCSLRAGHPALTGSGYRSIQRPVFHGEDALGSIEITADLHDLRERNRRILLLAIALAFLSIVVASISGAVLQHHVSRPIVELVRVMNQVTSRGVHSARVPVEGNDEVAQLASGFNRMIAELERRNQIAKTAELRLLDQSRTDSLTGLPNRRYFSEQLDHELARVRREDRMLGLLYIDLDGFKLVNDSLGHAIGDLLLTHVAQRFKSRVRASDMLARLGGDEFTVILTALQSEDDAADAAEGLIRSLARPFVIDGNQITVGASIGISTLCPALDGEADLLKQADSAMYAAKRSGKNRAVQFSSELGLMARERLILESELRGAIGRGEIYVVYQPELALNSEKIARFEALARWRHPHLGEISPATFIPIAEESGMIHALGEYVMEQACRECLMWQELSPDPVQVAVNVSALQFSSETFVDMVKSTLDRIGVIPKLLQVELTESVMLGSVTHAAAKMNKLRSMGVSLAIDDFGTGYSSLGYLSGLPFTALKIDRAFLRDLREGGETNTMMQSMIDLGHKMRMRVIVEGIESEDQLDMVKRMGADDVQGYLLGRPSENPAADYGSVLRREVSGFIGCRTVADLVAATSDV